MNIKASKAHEAVVPTATLADIAFLLIIFFMLTLQFEVDKTQVELPETAVRLEVPKKAAYIAVTEDGLIKVSSGEELSVAVPGVEDVLTFASNVVAENPEKPFVLKADSEVSYDVIDRVIEAMKQAKVKVIYLLSDAEAQQIASEGDLP